jgi:hypothetical protein
MGAADEHGGELEVFPDELMAHKLLESALIRLNPPPEVERDEGFPATGS